MKLDSIEKIFQALNSAGVRYLVAGGFAVNAHGYLRFTKDVDFVLQLAPDNIQRAFTALGDLGYRPNTESGVCQSLQSRNINSHRRIHILCQS